MAAPRHSRFTDEIYATTLPSPSTIEARTTEAIHQEIFANGNHRNFANGLIVAEELKAKQLYENYPPRFRDKNKQFIFELLNSPYPYQPLPDKKICLTRWKPFLAMKEEGNPRFSYEFRCDVFDYNPEADTHKTHWHLNFADNNLFGFYAGPLLAQDELQVLECVELASLREYFNQAEGKDMFCPIGSDAHNGAKVSTPVLISNVERVLELDTREIYGNAFAKASKETLKKAFRRKEPPQTVNLIAIEAPSYGRGPYSIEDISYIIKAAYTGFKAAQIMTYKTFQMNRGPHVAVKRGESRNPHDIRTVVHSGWWGCGAFGNNRQLILVAQLLSANWSMIDKIVFHVQNKDHQADIDKAVKLYEELIKIPDVAAVIRRLADMNFQWERSNNT